MAFAGMDATPPRATPLKPSRSYPALSRTDMFPPARPKWATPPKRKLSAEMQGHLDSIVTKRDAGAAGPSRLQGTWDSERIAHVLTCKLDEFTKEGKTHTQRLVRAVGEAVDADPFERGHRNEVRMSPATFNRVCNRFNLSCDEAQAREIFQSCNLPEPCNIYTLTKNLTKHHSSRRAQPRGLIPVASAPSLGLARASQPDPYKLARLTDNAWREHRQQSAPVLPPIRD